MDIVLLAKQTASAISIAKYIKNSFDVMDNAEQKLKLAELIEALADIKMETAEIKSTLLEKDEKILELEKKLNLKENLIYDRPCYWIKKEKNKDGPFCQKCYDLNKKLIRLKKYDDEYWTCLVCEEEFLTENMARIRSEEALEAVKQYNSNSF